jgi:hypothetical protein
MVIVHGKNANEPCGGKEATTAEKQETQEKHQVHKQIFQFLTIHNQFHQTTEAKVAMLQAGLGKGDRQPTQHARAPTIRHQAMLASFHHFRWRYFVQ